MSDGPVLDTPKLTLQFPPQQMRKLRLLAAAFEEELNRVPMAAHRAAGRSPRTYKRQIFTVTDLIMRAVELFMAPYDDSAEKLKE